MLKIISSYRVDRAHRGSALGDLATSGFASTPGKSRILAAARAPIALTVIAAVLLRSAAMLGYHQAFWHGDTTAYVTDALRIVPNPWRPAGYSVFLRMFLDFHSSALVVAAQHLLGLVTGILIYALLRRWQVRPVLAAAASLPLLLDPRQLVIEHALLSETLFTCLVTGAVVVTLWRRRLTPRTVAAAALLLTAATLTRSIGLPLVLLFLGLLVAWRVTLRTLLTAVATCLVPLCSYGLWFQAHNNVFALGSNDGILLWSRTMSFADCSKIRPPADLIQLCPPEPHRAAATWPWNFLLDTKRPQEYLTDENAWLYRRPGPPLSPENNSLARNFALRAIVAQPVDYALIVLRDLTDTVLRRDPPVHGDPAFLFPAVPDKIPPEQGEIARTYGYSGAPTAVAPFAAFLERYQYLIFLPGLMLFLAMVTPAVLMLRCKRRLSIPALLPWSMAVALLVLATATNQNSYRFALPAVPLACIALALSITPAVRRGTARVRGAINTDRTSSHA
ncbi:hypothetical protein [Planotetraspora mira]|nr:hypothetical protein [Planotetraspora mira]